MDVSGSRVRAAIKSNPPGVVRKFRAARLENQWPGLAVPFKLTQNPVDRLKRATTSFDCSGEPAH